MKWTRRWTIASIWILLFVWSGIGEWSAHEGHHAKEPLLSAVVAIGANGERVSVPPGKPLKKFFPGTRVLASTGLAGQVAADAQLAWVASGKVPEVPAEYHDLVSTALLDIHTLLLPNGAAVAGWPQLWRHVWPRDASMVAVALSRTGHTQNAISVLNFLQRQLPPSGIFEARYLLDGSGAPDSRGEQADGTGWVLWAARMISNDIDPGSRRRSFLTTLKPLIDQSTRTALRLTAGPGAMPAPSQDYWEVRDERLSLGTVAPLAFGLEAAAELQRDLGNDDLALAAGERAKLLRTSIAAQFGRQGYPRYRGDGERDASIAFLLPPFTSQPNPNVVNAWRMAAHEMRRPAGGLAPGAGWKRDGISWSPQTALFALTAASIGDDVAAKRWLTWINDHRTEYGAIPEKVLSDGEPSGPAPLAWTDALVILAADAMSG